MSSGTRTTTKRRTSLIGAMLMLACVSGGSAAVPASAGAAIRTGSIEDPQGDTSSLSGAALDIKSVAARYDDIAGTLRVTWTYYDDVGARDDPNAHPGGIFVANDPAGADDAGVVQWYSNLSSDSSWIREAMMQIDGSSGTIAGTVATSEDGRVVTAAFTNAGLAGHDWRRGWSFGNVVSGDKYDEFWFDGYAPKPPVPDPTPPPGSGATPPPDPGTTPPADPGGGANAPQGMTINAGALYTNDPDVTLSVVSPGWADSLRVANDGGFRAAKAFPVRSTIRWRLAESGRERLPKTVYLRFGDDAQTFTDDIILDQTDPVVGSARVEGPAAGVSAAPGATAAARSRSYRVRIRAKDTTSGVAKAQFALRSKRHPSALRKFQRIIRYKGSRAPRYVRVRDRAGNYSRWRAVR